MKRTAFTIIELIFVIVILGILASVAIPKLKKVKQDHDNQKIEKQYGDVGAEYK